MPETDQRVDAFFDAIKRGDLESVQSLIRPDWLNIKERPSRDLPIHVALRHSTEEVVKLLIQNKCNTNGPTTWNNTSLHLACDRGFIDIVRILLEKTDKIDVPGQWDWTPLHFAAWKGRANVVDLLVKRNCNTQALTKAGRSALELARQKNFQECVRILEKCEVAHLKTKHTSLLSETQRSASDNLKGKKDDQEMSKTINLPIDSHRQASGTLPRKRSEVSSQNASLQAAAQREEEHVVTSKESMFGNEINSETNGNEKYRKKTDTITRRGSGPAVSATLHRTHVDKNDESSTPHRDSKTTQSHNQREPQQLSPLSDHDEVFMPVNCERPALRATLQSGGSFREPTKNLCLIFYDENMRNLEENRNHINSTFASLNEFLVKTQKLDSDSFDEDLGRNLKSAKQNCKMIVCFFLCSGESRLLCKGDNEISIDRLFKPFVDDQELARRRKIFFFQESTLRSTPYDMENTYLVCGRPLLAMNSPDNANSTSLFIEHLCSEIRISSKPKSLNEICTVINSKGREPLCEFFFSNAGDIFLEEQQILL